MKSMTLKRSPEAARRASSTLRGLGRPLAIALLAVALAGPARTLDAQQADAPRYRHVISANPFGLVLLFFNAELERALNRTSTLGIGGSLFTGEDALGEDEVYVNADVFWRYYPGAQVFEGWSFGTKAGLTHIPDNGTFFGFGFDLNRSWLLGENDKFYVGAGFGLKRLVGAGDRDLDLAVIPTIRLVNIGFAF